MAQVGKHEPAQLVAGLIVNPAEGFDRVRSALEAAWGAIERESDTWPFDYTDYYETEMGAALLRRFLVFRDLREVDGLHRVKIESNRIEAELAASSSAGVARPVNIDPGYVSLAKLVLFTMKDFAHRIYIGDGVFAEITLEWRGGEFVPHERTFPDYRTAKYRDFFADVHTLYARRLKARRAGEEM